MNEDNPCLARDRYSKVSTKSIFLMHLRGFVRHFFFIGEIYIKKSSLKVMKLQSLQIAGNDKS